METNGFIIGKIGLGLTVFMIISVIVVFVVMLLANAPFILMVMFGALVLFVLYSGAFAVTKYHIDEAGIQLESILSFCNKEGKWNDIVIIEEAILKYTNQGRGGFGEYYIISMLENIERESGVMEMMKCKNVFCIPVTKETKACMTYYALRNQLSITRKRYG